MARIRTIKPDFFRHERLFEAERETGLPLRVAFAGLWTACDREGRFRWSPRQLKLDCLPYDEVDFSRVLDALATRGFIVKYRVADEDFGAVPSWKRHQVINNRETASDLPEPSETNTLTRAARVADASPTPLGNCKGEGKGREGKGREGPLSEEKLVDPRKVFDALKGIAEAKTNPEVNGNGHADFSNPEVRKQAWVTKITNEIKRTYPDHRAEEILNAYAIGEPWAKKEFNKVDSAIKQRRAAAGGMERG